MAFDLMQEEIIAKFTWFGKKIGLIEIEEEDDDDDDEDLKKNQNENSNKLNADSPKFDAEKSSVKQAENFNRD